MRVALYARVSTDDKDQDPETQLMHLRKEAARLGHPVIREYVDIASGRTVRGRPEYKLMLDGARRKAFDGIMVYKLDRLHRRVVDALSFFEEIRLRGIDLISTSQQIDTSTAFGRAMMQIVAVFAELESANTAERSAIGTERAKVEGKICNRPKRELSAYQLEKAKEIIAANPRISGHELARHFEGIDRKTLLSRLREAGVF